MFSRFLAHRPPLAFSLGVLAAPAYAAGDLSRQEPITVTVDLGALEQARIHSEQAALRNRQALQTGSAQCEQRSAYFTSHTFSQMVFTRKVQVTQMRDGKAVTLAEFKGAIREIEVYPGHSAEWWFVPVATGRVTDLQCGIHAVDGRTHAEHGMTGEIVIE